MDIHAQADVLNLMKLLWDLGKKQTIPEQNKVIKSDFQNDIIS